MAHNFFAAEISQAIDFHKAAVAYDEMEQLIVSIGAAIKELSVTRPALILPRVTGSSEKEGMDLAWLFESVSNHSGAILLPVIRGKRGKACWGGFTWYEHSHGFKRDSRDGAELEHGDFGLYSVSWRIPTPVNLPETVVIVRGQNSKGPRSIDIAFDNEGPSTFLLPTEIRKVLEPDRKSTRLNSSHRSLSRMPSSA